MGFGALRSGMHRLRGGRREAMYREILRDESYIRRLRAALRAQYGIEAYRITPAERGYYGETWKVQTASGDYFLKIDALPFHRVRFRRGLSVVDYLCGCGVDFAGEVVRTRRGELCWTFDGAAAGLFACIDGKNVETDQTKPAEYQMLCQVYRLTKPWLGLPAATFSDEAAGEFYRRWEALAAAPKTEGDRALLALLEKFRDSHLHCARQLSRLAARCGQEKSPLYLTHGDAGGNFFAGKTQNYILDWDEAMYAPPERDAWVMGCYGWARDLFDDTLAANGVDGRLSMERLAYYCFHMYFFYLNEFLTVQPVCDQTWKAAGYLEDGWIKSRVAFADTVSRALCTPGSMTAPASC